MQKNDHKFIYDKMLLKLKSRSSYQLNTDIYEQLKVINRLVHQDFEVQGPSKDGASNNALRLSLSLLAPHL